MTKKLGENPKPKSLKPGFNKGKEVKPTLMQYAEPEYMCECGYKFYTYDWKPNYCSYCGEKFNWEDYAFKE